jgi:hypothetical protein
VAEWIGCNQLKDYDQIEKLKRFALESKAEADKKLGNEQEIWKIISENYHDSAQYLNNAIRADSSNKLNIAKLWHQAASYSQQAGEELEKVVQAQAEKNDKEVEVRLVATAHLLMAQAKEKKDNILNNVAEAERKIEVTKQWRGEATKLFKDFISSFLKGVDTTRKPEEGESLMLATASFYWASQTLVEAIEAEAEGNAVKALLCYRTTKLLQNSADSYLKAAVAHGAGKTDVAQKWLEVAKLYQDSIEPSIKAAAVASVIARVTEKTEEGWSWNVAGGGLTQAADKLGKAIEAEAEGKPEVALIWRMAAKLHQDSVDPFLKAAAALSTGKIVEGTIWLTAGAISNQAAEKLGNVIETNSQGKPEVAQQLRDEAQAQVETTKKAVEALGKR